MRIALAGNPNSGKTTMYNALTGKNERVGNWAGVTVDKRVSPIKKSFYDGEELIAVDLPGAYSMSPFTSEESITSGYVKNENPDVIINIVDATNLSRSLFFTTQLMELGIPVVVALNKSDVNEKKETKIDVEALSAKLGCPVVNTVSTSANDNGLAEVVKAAVALKGTEQKAPYVQGDINLMDKAAVEAADRKRFDFTNKIVSEVETRKVLTKEKNFQDKIDAVLTNKWLGIPIFAVVMFLVFYISQSTVGTWLAEGLGIGNVADGGLAGWLGDFSWYANNFVDEAGEAIIPGLVTWIEMFQGWVAGLLENANANVFLADLLTEGIIGGVGAVVGFLPLVMVMYFLLAMLEDCGYMARVSVVLDPIFKRVGLSGKSVIPMVIGTGCAIPGIMACRTIRDERERRATAMLTPFMPCGAKLPVISLFAGAFFPDTPWVGPMMYFAGIIIIFLGALLVKKITCYKYRKSFFIMELPEYKLPSVKRALLSMLDRGWAYIVKAGTIILVCNAVVHIMATFNWQFQTVGDAIDTSILATIAKPIAYLIAPVVGIVSWKLAAAAVTGFIAKEEVVGVLATVYAISEKVITDGEFVGSGGGEQMLGISAVAGLAYLMFNLFTPPCFAAMGAMNSEIKSKKWLFGGIGLQFATGFVVAFLVYQIGTLITTGTLGGYFFPGLIAVLAIVAIIAFIAVRANQKMAKEYALKKKA